MLSNWSFISIGLVFIFVFVFFRLTNLIFNYFLKNHYQGKYFIPFLNVAELIIWLIMLIWLLFKFEGANVYLLFTISFIIAFLLYYLFTFFVKDWVAGSLIKFQNQIKPGHFIEVGEVTGEIVRMNAKYIVIDSKYRVVYMPYSKLMEQEWYKRKNEDEKALLTFAREFENVKNVQLFKKQLLNKIISLPWTDLEYEPKIELLDYSDTYVKLEITILALDKSFFPLIKENLRNLVIGEEIKD